MTYLEFDYIATTKRESFIEVGLDKYHIACIRIWSFEGFNCSQIKVLGLEIKCKRGMDRKQSEAPSPIV